MKQSLKIKFAIISFLAKLLQKYRVFILKSKGYDIDWSVIIERGYNFDRIYTRGIHIDKNTLIASRVTILSHDHCKRINEQPLLADVYIGKNCFIAVGAILMPGIRIGDEVIIGAGSVVTKNIPSNTIAVGNPARIIKTDIRMNKRAEWSNWSTASINNLIK